MKEILEYLFKRQREWIANVHNKLMKFNTGRGFRLKKKISALTERTRIISKTITGARIVRIVSLIFGNYLIKHREIEEEIPSHSILASKLLAAASYTRGLWSPFFIWKKISPPPFTARCPQWGIDEKFVRMHNAYATYNAILLLIIELILFLIFILTQSSIIAVLFIFIVIFQWFLFPWVSSKRIFKKENELLVNQEKINNIINDSSIYHRKISDAINIVTDENDLIVNDLGYLVREAIFSVDTAKRSDIKDNCDKKNEIPCIEEFYSMIEEEMQKLKNCSTTTYRVKIKSHLFVQPKGFSWYNLDSNSFSKENPERLFVLAQDSEYDGLATAEIGIKETTPHFSFHIRLRWLPPLRRRFQNLLLLSRQHLWWRICTIPFVMLFFFVLQLSFVSFVPALTGQDFTMPNIYAYYSKYFDFIKNHEQFFLAQEDREINELDEAYKSAFARLKNIDSEEVLSSDELNLLTQERTNLIAFIEQVNVEKDKKLSLKDNRSVVSKISLFLVYKAINSLVTLFGPLVMFLFIINIFPIFLFVVVFLWRILRYIRGVLYIISGTTFKFDSPDSLSFSLAEFDIKTNQALYNGIFYQHLFEEIILNKIISVLQEYSIETDSIKQEFKTFHNDGIYITGGSIQAENIAVGAWSNIVHKVIKRKKTLERRRGKSSLLKQNTISKG